jgi:hypothetical protein
VNSTMRTPQGTDREITALDLLRIGQHMDVQNLH